ncbi:CHAT domain-containing protein [Actinokineospora sp. NPDC004072]
MTLPRVLVDVTRPDAAGGWSVDVLGVGVEASYPMPAAQVESDGRRYRVPGPAAPEVGKLLKRIRDRAAEDGDVAELGRWLFRCLIAPVWDQIRQAQETRDARGVELALRWSPDDTDLHQLAWEAMHDGTGFLAGDTGLLIAITRVVAGARTEQATITGIPRVLFAVGEELGKETIRAGAMFMGLLRGFETDGVCSTTAVDHVTLDSLAKHCAEERPDLVHLVAHGEPDGAVRLGGERVDAESLAVALTPTHRPLAAVVSACGSGASADGGRSLAARLVAAGIPIVSAVVGDVSEQACRLYTKRWVQAVTDGLPLAVAVAAGRRAAVQNSGGGGRAQLDWAMPALFVADTVEASFQPFDSTRARWLVNAANRLHLRDLPLFFGRERIIQTIDKVFAPVPTEELDVIGAITADDIHGLGGTRLLREIGYRLLLRGHLPVMIGPYPAADPPASVRDLVARIAQGMALTANALQIPPLPCALAERYLPEGVVSPDKYDLADARERFAADPAPLSWERARMGLVDDAQAFRAAAAAKHPDLFGDHTTLVVLADDLHRWGVLDEVVAWLQAPGSRGFGDGDERVPAIFAASTRDAKAASLKSMVERHSSLRFAFPELTGLTDVESVIGYQWVLLHPWKCEGETDDPCRYVYTARAGISDDELAYSFETQYGRKPVAVKHPMFHRRAMQMVLAMQLVQGDDEAAWTAYQRKYP